MNFDNDYQEFIDHLEKQHCLYPTKLDKREDVAVRLFVAYLNIRYKNARAPLTSRPSRAAKAQRKWEDHVDAECNHYFDREGD